MRLNPSPKACSTVAFGLLQLISLSRLIQYADYVPESIYTPIVGFFKITAQLKRLKKIARRKRIKKNLFIRIKQYTKNLGKIY